MTGGHRHSQYCLKISGIPGNAWFPQLAVTYIRINRLYCILYLPMCCYKVRQVRFLSFSILLQISYSTYKIHCIHSSRLAPFLYHYQELLPLSARIFTCSSQQHPGRHLYRLTITTVIYTDDNNEHGPCRKSLYEFITYFLLSACHSMPVKARCRLCNCLLIKL